MSNSSGLGGRTVTADDKRELLLDVAEQVFGTLGYAGTTMAELAKAAGVTRPTVYAYFSSKDEVFRALADRVRKEFLRLQEQPPLTEPPAAMVRQIVAQYLAAYVRHRKLLTVLAHQALSDDEFYEVRREVFARVERRNTRFLERMTEQGAAKPVVPPEAISAAVTGLVARFAELAAAEPARLAALAGEVADMYLCLAGMTDDG
ncbi:TetR/AcrR family transcriptional regulator [Thermocrispum municipale]|uniref:TetR/AcrR family transcriptional regulator n=1 Tax=Thermocrispum municipale TaxID=37926 RepID=UPI0005B814C7|nr:TetR/AcrR family transcriptional regulator [Thermocrispum municipale]